MSGRLGMWRVPQCMEESAHASCFAWDAARPQSQTISEICGRAVLCFLYGHGCLFAALWSKIFFSFQVFREMCHILFPPRVFFCFPPRWGKGVVHGYGHVCFFLIRSLGESVTPGPMHGLLFFPSFLFIIALVIKRKQLSPEARKQTRASESLKVMSKVHCYVSQHFCLL